MPGLTALMETPVERPAPAPASAPVPADESADRALVRLAQSGDLGAFDELVVRYQERIYALVYHMTSNHEDANDE